MWHILANPIIFKVLSHLVEGYLQLSLVSIDSTFIIIILNK